MSINLKLDEVEGRDVCLIHEPAEVAIVGAPEAVRKVVELLRGINQPTPAPAPAPIPAPTRKTAIVRANRLIVRERPTVKSREAGSVGLMARVVILEEQAGWGRIEQGWIELGYIEAE